MHFMSKRTQPFLFHLEYFWINAAHRRRRGEKEGVGEGMCWNECRQGLQEKNIVEV